MRTISQVAELTGISIRTLQYYDEIGLLKPSALTQSNYRLYDDDALQKLQQILFFKELGFQLKEISRIFQQPDFNRIEAFKQQKELLLLKRNRIDRLIQLLGRLEEGEQCMSFKEFDLSDYINALEEFKTANTNVIIQHWGNVENFDMFIQKIKDDEPKVAKLAIKQFGSVEKYTEAMKYNLEHFSEIVDEQLAQIPEEMKQGDLYSKLAAHMEMDIASDEVQHIVQEIVAFAQKYAPAGVLDQPDNYCRMIIDTYSGDYVKAIFDTKHGAGASEYVADAFRYYVNNTSAKSE